MPKSTDHEERRRFVVEVTSQLISSAGLDAVSLRNVSKAAGYSTAIVNHYFTDKQQLLLMTYVAAAERSRARLQGILAGRSPVLREAVIGLLPLTDETKLNWAIYLAFLGSGVGTPALSREQARWSEQTEKQFEGILKRELRGAGASKKAEGHARRLINFITGTSIAMLTHPSAWPKARVLGAVDEELRILTLAWKHIR
jgi:AcrR family transcriptional regulator